MIQIQNFADYLQITDDNALVSTDIRINKDSVRSLRKTTLSGSDAIGIDLLGRITVAGKNSFVFAFDRVVLPLENDVDDLLDTLTGYVWS